MLTNDNELAKVMRQIARHGQVRRYHHVRVGVNSRLDTLQTAILLPKLAIFDEELAQRQRLAHTYNTPSYVGAVSDREKPTTTHPRPSSPTIYRTPQP